MKTQLSERTKTCRIRKWIFTLFHWLALLGPFFYFIPYCFATGDMVSKIVIGFAVIVCILMAGIALIVDAKHRAGLHKSGFWGLIAACAYVLESVTPFVILMAAVSIVDELIFTKLKDYYAAAQLTNTEIDRRNNSK